VVSAGSYLLSVVLLAAVVLSVGFSAFRIRRHLLPAWEGAPARLVEAVLAVALLIWLCELLGLFGLLYASTLVIESLLLAAGVAIWTMDASSVGGAEEGGDRTGEPANSPLARERARGPDAMSLIAIAVVFVVFVHWGTWTREPLDLGIVNWDSLSFHMPFAADIAQSHSVTGLSYVQTVAANWFYPENSELLHAIGILLTGHDTLSLFVNFGWLGLAFLAAWCVGRPYGRGPLTVVAAAILLGCNTYLLREPGSGKNDVMEVALLLAAVAILVNAWERHRGRRAGRSAAAMPLGWPLAAAGLAAGLAVGTRVTVIATVIALSAAVVALSPKGERWRAAGWWFLPAAAGGGFWYLRNLVVAGNPVPDVERLGPLVLPHPERVQSGWPDFSVAHYLTDSRVWTDYFGPGLEYSFGVLWPLVLAVAIGGALLALGWGRNSLSRWLGGVALFGLLVYLITPHSAGGPEGAPATFAINTRFAIPALLTGSVLLPLARGLDRVPRRWTMLVALLAILVVTDRSYDVLDDRASFLGLAVAFFAVLAPAAILLARRWGGSGRGLAVELGLLAIVLAAIGYPLQNDYLRDRYSDGIPWFQLDSSYRWARGVRDARIGVVGTTAGVLQYGFFGPDASNRVRYMGVRGPRGAFNPIPDCSDFREAVNDAHLDYLVTAPFLNYVRPGESLDSPEAGWLRGERGVEAVDRNGAVTVWRVRGQLDPAGCGSENAPLRFVPRQPAA